jgi:hypothetical protein
MKTPTLLKIAALTLTLSNLISTSSHASETSAAKAIAAEVLAVGENAFVAPNYKPGLIKHIVLFRYNDSVTTEQKRHIRDRFKLLAQSCLRNGKPYIISIETGEQNSGEGVDQELEQGFIITFKSEGDRNYYVGKGIVQKNGNFDPAHDDFKNFVGTYLHIPIDPSGVLVFDFKEENKK